MDRADLGAAAANATKAIAAVATALGIGETIAAGMKTLGASSHVAAGTGYVAVAVVLVAVAYDAFQHIETYPMRRQHLREQIEAGLSKFASEVLRVRADVAIEDIAGRLRVKTKAQAMLEG